MTAFLSAFLKLIGNDTGSSYLDGFLEVIGQGARESLVAETRPDQLDST